MLEVETLHVAYGGVTALDGVSLKVPDRAITAVLGPNGAGKSTLLRTIGGLVPPRSGRVTYGGRTLTGMAPEEIARAGVALVPEGGGSIRELTVEENLRLAHLWRRDAVDRRKAMDEVMELFPALAARRHLPAHSLSGGERQMLGLGRALMSRASLLLLDEPSLGLAPKLVTLIMRTVRDLAGRGLSVLLVEQNARSALSIADDAVLLSSGRTVAARRAGELAKQEELWHAYLGY